MADDGDTQYLIPESNYAKFEKEIQRLSRKSEKLGGDPITLVVFGYEMVEKGRGQAVKCFNVLVGSPKISIPGYEMVALLDHVNKDVGNLSFTLPGKLLPPQYRGGNCTSLCEHCNVNRKRTKTFVLFNQETNTHLQVGATCLGDFLQVKSGDAIAKMAELLSYIDTAARGYSQIHDDGDHFNVEELMANAVLSVEESNGFISYKESRIRDLPSTASRALDHIYAMSRMIGDLERRGMNPALVTSKVKEHHYEKAREVIAWARDLGEDGAELSEYLGNVKVLMSAEHIHQRFANYAVSALGAFIRHHTPLIVQESEYLGEVDKELIVEVTVADIKEWEGNYGVLFIHTCLTANNNSVTFFTKRKLAQPTETIRVKGIVTKHEAYKGHKKTVINKVKVLP